MIDTFGNPPEKIDWSKPLMTRRGRPARLLARVKNKGRPMLILWTDEAGNDVAVSLTQDGKLTHGAFDSYVINRPSKDKLVYMNIFRENSAGSIRPGQIFYNDEQSARAAAANPNYVDTVRIHVTVPE